jgi:small subunit ribosomal protein S4e
MTILGKHLKRYATPKTWRILRKAETYITKPNAGAHPISRALPLSVVMKNIGVAHTTREAKKILVNKNVLVDGKKVQDHKKAVGLFDVITLSDINKSYQVKLDSKGKLAVEEVKDANSKACRIEGKTVLKKGKMQLNLSGGKNIIVDKDGYKVGDSVIIELPSQKITKHLKLEANANVLLTAGRHLGSQAKVTGIEGNEVQIKVGDVESHTNKNNTYVIQ